MKYVTDINLNQKRVLIRADLDVPLNENREVSNDTKIKRFLPTLKYVLEQGGVPVVVAHLGNPNGKTEPNLSLKPVADKIKEIAGIDVIFSEECTGQNVLSQISSLTGGQTLLLENLRFHPEERKNSLSFSEELSRLGDIYVGDAFSLTNQNHASVVGLPKCFSERTAGLLIKDELEFYRKAIKNPQKPLCVIFGGVKVSTKINALLNIAEKADKIVIGGAMANTFLAAQGIQMGRSLYEAEFFPELIGLMAALARRGCKLYLPIDFRVGASLQSKGISRVVTSLEVPPESMALDIGPATSLLYNTAVTNAETIVWNGPMGTFENEDYSQGTHDLVQTLGSAHGLTVAGGRNTGAAIHQMELEHKFDYISSGTEAFLTLLEGKVLPGIESLK